MKAETEEELTRAADDARARLLDKVVRLDERRRRALDVPKQMGRSMWHFGLALGAIAAAGVTALVLHGLASRDTRRRRDRWLLLKTAWRHPDRELRAQRRPFGVEVMRSLLFTLVTSALSIPLRRAVRAATAGPTERGPATPKPTAQTF